ncbi:uncharacterized protein HKW66_Vig0007570 [Vigna angularis]|uniref:Uncharacterized protein n=2 Tax=Phaseolus angularis TaxID=3914 RepID=A0A8T0LEP7_PHAAN|nr:uncharacterized protein HKW66_Vig0007570 [Vigna angularis]BAT73801.1 hypothetical protein VIGAN_01133800 [Vigna angularis var. angularis]
MDQTNFLFEFKFVSSLCLHNFLNLLCQETVSFLSVFSSDPLFHCVVTFCTLVFLYLPNLFLKVVLSPVLILTSILLLSILRLGAIQKSRHDTRENQRKHDEESIIYEENRGSKCRGEKQSSSPIEPNETETTEQVHQRVHSETEVDSDVGFEPSSCFKEWNVKAPLEVIYEEYGEGEDAGDDANESVGIVRYPSLSRFYPESDSDSESDSDFPAIGDWDSPEDVEFRWGQEGEEEEEEEDREGLIEIALDGFKRKRGMEFHFDEENLIEIDISPSRYRELSGDEEVFSGFFLFLDPSTPKQ